MMSAPRAMWGRWSIWHRSYFCIKKTCSPKSWIYTSVGILTYECLVGVTPFYMPTEKGIARAILDGTFSIPSHLSPETVSFLKSTLHTRSCTTPECRRVAETSYFNGRQQLAQLHFSETFIRVRESYER